MTNTVEVAVAHGFAHGGQWCTSLWLRPWCGHDELFLREEAGSAPPAARATAILARCAALDGGAEPATPDLLRTLTVSDREALMLHLWRITAGERMACILRCPVCREKLDLDLEASSLLVRPYGRSNWDLTASIETVQGRFEVRFRLPNGGDQETLATLAVEDEDKAASEALRRCVRQVLDAGGEQVAEIPEAVASRIPEVMAEADPQAEILLSAACPACGASFDAPLDASQFVLRSMEQGGESLDREIHLLAWYYHWSESEILGRSGRRRRRYLELIADSLGERRAP